MGLAGLFDPDSKYHEREFVIRNRRSSKQPRHALKLQIALFIAQEIARDIPIESAKQAATEGFAVSMSTVERAWREHKESKIIGRVWKAGRTIN
jgi:hypothetical protein